MGASVAKNIEEIGYLTASGMVYCGQNLDGQYIYAPPEDIGYYYHSDAPKVLEAINRDQLHGECNWVLPTGKTSKTDELHNLLYLNREEIGNFHTGIKSNVGACRYLSATAAEERCTFIQFFDSGAQCFHPSHFIANIRPIVRKTKLEQ